MIRKMGYVLAALLLASGVVLEAQTHRGAIRGRVEDASGAGVRGAEVRAVNEATNETRTTATGDTGAFAIAELEPGSWRIEIAAPGHIFRVQTLFAGDELGWSAMLGSSGKQFQARALERTEALAFEAADLLAACRDDPAFGFVLMHRLLGVVAERLQATRVQLLDSYSPVAARAGA